MELARRRTALGRLARSVAAAITCGLLVSAAFAGSTSASFNVTVRILPTARELILQAEIKARRPDGTIAPLTSEQKLHFTKDRSSALKEFKPDPDGYVRVLIEM